MNNVHVLIHFQVKPIHEKETLEVLTRFVNATRQTPGCFQSNLFESIEDRGHYTLIEIWNSEESQEKHINSHHFREFAPFIGTRVEKLNVQRIARKY